MVRKLGIVASTLPGGAVEKALDDVHATDTQTRTAQDSYGAATGQITRHGTKTYGTNTYGTNTYGTKIGPKQGSPKLAVDAVSPPTNPSAAMTFASTVGGWNNKGAVLVTTETVEQAISNKAWPASTAAKIRRALQKDGPLGASGPLGRLGALGDRPWNPSYWTRRIGHWTGLAKTLENNGGPTSNDGPLGDHGPLAKHDEFDPLFVAGGPLAAFGPTGVLGPLSSLGVLGPNGGHGFAPNDSGEYVDESGSVQRKLQVQREGGTREYELVEFYSSEQAKAMKDNDTSWMVRGATAADQAGDTYGFQSNQEQFVTLAVVPEKADEAFQVELLDAAGDVIAKSSSEASINWIHIQADEGRKLQVRVRRLPSGDSAKTMVDHTVETMLAPLVFSFGMLDSKSTAPQSDAYRLFVVGSSEDVDASKVEGQHQRRFDWN